MLFRKLNAKYSPLIAEATTPLATPVTPQFVMPIYSMGSGGQTPHRQQPPFLLFSPLPTPPPFHHLAPPAISAMPGTPIIPNTPTLPVTPIIPNAPALPGTPTMMLRYPGHSISFSQILSSDYERDHP